MGRNLAIAWLAAYVVVAAGTVGGFAYAVARQDVIVYLLGFGAGSVLVFTAFQFFLEHRESASAGSARANDAAPEAERQDALAGPRSETAVIGPEPRPVEATKPVRTGGVSRETDGAGSVGGPSLPSERVPRERGPGVNPRAGQAGNTRASAVANTLIPVAAGVVAAYLVAHHQLGFPAGSIGVGALTVALTLFFVHGRTYYAAGGALFCLVTAVVIWTGVFPDGYGGSPAIALATLGSIGAVVVLLYLGLGSALRRLLARIVGEDVSLHIYDLVTGIPRLLGSLWAAVTVRPDVVRFLAITLGAGAGLLLNYLGIVYPIPWSVAEGIDAAMVLFVGAILLGFHTLESLHTNLLETSGSATPEWVTSRDG